MFQQPIAVGRPLFFGSSAAHLKTEQLLQWQATRPEYPQRQVKHRPKTCHTSDGLDKYRYQRPRQLKTTLQRSALCQVQRVYVPTVSSLFAPWSSMKIGRASCRERVKIEGVAG